MSCAGTGTRGAAIGQGASEIKIHGEYVPILAEVESLDTLSAHGDYTDILGWLGQMPSRPAGIFLTHGEPAAADALRVRIQDELGWNCETPQHGDTVDLER
jgi:metallo-beta-lactamase family protein